MGGMKEPPPGGGSKPPDIDENSSGNIILDQRTSTPAWADNSVPGRNLEAELLNKSLRMKREIGTFLKFN